LKRTGLAPALAAGLLMLLASCGSPIITGMKVHIQNGEYQDAIDLADQAIASGENVTAELWIWRGKAMGNLRDWAGAAESFTQAYGLDPSVAPDLADFWYVYYNTAANLAADGSTADAIAMLEQGTTIVPSRPEFDMMLGDIALNSDDLIGALDHFETSWQLSDPIIADLQERLDTETDPAVLDWLQQTLDGAVANGVLSLYNAGTISKSLSTRTEDDAEKQMYIDRAMTAFETALVYDPANADILSAVAEVYLVEGDYGKALEVFDEALAGVHQGVDEGWLTQDEADEMIGNIKLTKGFALLEMGEYEEAITELNETLQLLGREYSVMANVAHAYFQMEEYEEALQYLDEITEITGLTTEQLGYTHYMRFACYIRMEEDEAAAEALETALQYDPDNADYWEYLASTYSRLGRRNDAVEAMQRAEELRGN
jgi:tetratricopeptide (TPR) repeat protein